MDSIDRQLAKFLKERESGKKPQMLVSFSCGAASAVAAYLALKNYSKHYDIHICRWVIDNEHPDSDRFHKDCEEWLQYPIKKYRSEKYKDYWEVFEDKKIIIVGGLTAEHGKRAVCTEQLKRRVSQRVVAELNISHQVLGYTNDENHRADRISSVNPEFTFHFPLIEHNLSKPQCWAVLKKAGIKIPEMYSLGFNNNNCIGCVKAGIGHWNKVRVVFPHIFARMAELERRICKWPFLATDRFSDDLWLDRLDATRGRYEDSNTDVECNAFCGMVI